MLTIHTVKTSELTPYANNAKLHPSEQIDQIAASIEEFGNCDPIAAWHNEDGGLEIVEGHGRLAALNRLGITEAPVIYLDHLSDEQRRAYCLIHNKLTMSTGFDISILNAELEAIEDIDMTGYDFTINVEATPSGGGDFEPPEEFKAYDEDIETCYKCERCGFEWS